MASLIDAFVQVNLIRGWRFLDDAGKVMNLYDDFFPEKRVGVEGLKMGGADSGPLKEMTVSAERVWMHYQKPGTLTLVRDQCFPHIADVARLLDVSHARRFGIRSQWVIGKPTKEAAFAAIRKATGIETFFAAFEGEPSGTGLEMSFSLPEGLSLTLRLNGAERLKSAPSEVPEFSVVADLDIFQANQEDGLAIDSFGAFSRKAELSSRSHLEILGNLLD